MEKQMEPREQGGSAMGNLAPGLHLQKSSLLEAFWENRPSSFESKSLSLYSWGNPYSSFHRGTDIRRMKRHFITKPPPLASPTVALPCPPPQTCPNSHSHPTQGCQRPHPQAPRLDHSPHYHSNDQLGRKIMFQVVA